MLLVGEFTRDLDFGVNPKPREQRRHGSSFRKEGLLLPDLPKSPIRNEARESLFLV